MVRFVKVRQTENRTKQCDFEGLPSESAQRDDLLCVCSALLIRLCSANMSLLCYVFALLRFALLRRLCSAMPLLIYWLVPFPITSFSSQRPSTQYIYIYISCVYRLNRCVCVCAPTRRRYISTPTPPNRWLRAAEAVVVQRQRGERCGAQLQHFPAQAQQPGPGSLAPFAFCFGFCCLWFCLFVLILFSPQGGSILNFSGNKLLLSPMPSFLLRT